VHQPKFTEWRTTNGHQPMSTELSQFSPDGEQQLGINQGSPDGGQQMGINPCPLSSPTTPNGERQLGINLGSPDGGQQMGINPCPYTMGDDKWESTHVHQTHLLKVCSHKNSRQRMGQGLQHSLVLGSHDHKRVWPQYGR
jgi:hypothetical protein